jgi:hypothetical protein
MLTASFTVHSPFSSDHLVCYMSLVGGLSCSTRKWLLMRAIKEQNTDTVTNNHSSNLNVGDVDDLWVMK